MIFFAFSRHNSKNSLIYIRITRPPCNLYWHCTYWLLLLQDPHNYCKLIDRLVIKFSIFLPGDPRLMLTDEYVCYTRLRFLDEYSIAMPYRCLRYSVVWSRWGSVRVHFRYTIISIIAYCIARELYFDGSLQVQQ